MLSQRFGIEALLHEPARLRERKATRARPHEALPAPRTGSRTKPAQTALPRRSPLVRR
jgi:hypothetical protein